MTDTYKTIEQPSEEILFKEKNSKFFGYAFPVQSEEEVKMILEQVKKQHFSARHWCYAYQIGTKTKNLPCERRWRTQQQRRNAYLRTDSIV